ncbi:MAG TPA: response regulator [Anaerolineales bacterium]|nr:response regulator [Anaerolineales bacterium]
MANETILVVDDSYEMRNLLDKYILSPLGYKVITSSNGKSGLESVVSGKPDLILLDMNMPKMTGLEMLAALRQTDCNCPVIFITSYGSENIAVEAFRLGVRDYLNKPFTADEVRLAVDRALNESRLAQERMELNRNLITAETVRSTVITLSHYLNNNIMAISGVLTLLSETLEQKEPDEEISEILQKGKESLRGIQAVMNVLAKTTDVKLTPYSQTTPMIDINKALKNELENMHPPDKMPGWL